MPWGSAKVQSLQEKLDKMLQKGTLEWGPSRSGLLSPSVSSAEGFVG